MKNLLNRFVRDEQGQDLIEYALLAGFISLVAVVAITASAPASTPCTAELNTKVAAIPTVLKPSSAGGMDRPSGIVRHLSHNE